MQVQPFSFRRLDLGSDLLGPGHGKEAAEPPPPVFTEQDVELAEQTGYNKGHAKGLIDGHAQAQTEHAELDRQLNGMLDALIGKLAPLHQSQQILAAQQKQLLPQLAHAIAEKIAGPALEKNALVLAEDIAMRAYYIMFGEPKLTISVHPSLKEQLEKRLADRLAAQVEVMQLAVIADAACQPGDCRVEWRGGLLERKLEDIQAQVRAAVDGMASASPFPCKGEGRGGGRDEADSAPCDSHPPLPLAGGGH